MTYCNYLRMCSPASIMPANGPGAKPAISTTFSPFKAIDIVYIYMNSCRFVGIIYNHYTKAALCRGSMNR